MLTCSPPAAECSASEGAGGTVSPRTIVVCRLVSPAFQVRSNQTMTTHSGPAMIEAVGLSKYYGDFTAIENVSFQIRQGEVVAFLGPNGAGKSTTMKLLTG